MTETRIPFPEHAWPGFLTGMQYLADEPRRLHMAQWIMPFDRADEFSDVSYADPEYWGDGATFRRRATSFEREHTNGTPPCGTAVCAAGAIVVANGLVDPKTDPINRILHVDWGQEALNFLGLARLSEAGDALYDVFEMTFEIDTYMDLVAELDRRFTFPGPLPTPKKVTA